MQTRIQHLRGARAIAAALWLVGCGGSGGGSRPVFPGDIVNPADVAEPSEDSGSGSDTVVEPDEASADVLEVVSPVSDTCIQAGAPLIVSTTLNGAQLEADWGDGAVAAFEPGLEPGLWVLPLALEARDEGPVSITVTGIRGDEPSLTQQIDVWLDKTPPALQLQSPTDETLVVGDLSVRGSVFEGSNCGVSRIVVELWREGADAPALSREEPGGLADLPFAFEVNVSEVESGRYTCRVTVFDEAGLSAEASREIDLVKPITYSVAVEREHGASGISSTRTVDFDQDGRDDLVLTGTDGVFWVPSLSGGRPGETTPLYDENCPLVEGYDFDSDNATDLIALCKQGTEYNVMVLRQGGDKTFIELQTVLVGQAVPSDSQLADLNGDGLLDFVFTTKETTKALGVMLGVPATISSFMQPEVSWFGGLVGVGDLDVADFNGDSVPDVVVASQGNNKVSVYLGTGDGKFLAAGDTLVQKDPVAVAHVLFPGDEYMDLVVASSSTGDVRVHLGQGNGFFEVSNNFDGRILSGGAPSSLITADLNGNGFAEILIALRGDKSIAVLKDVGFLNSLELYVAGVNPKSLAVGDFDGDGNLDATVLNDQAEAFNRLPGLGDGSFHAARGLFAPTELRSADVTKETLAIPTGMALGDFDAAPGLDLITTTTTFRVLGADPLVYFLYLYPFSGNSLSAAPLALKFPGEFPHNPGPEEGTENKGGLVALNAGDFDGNGLRDIAVANALQYPPNSTAAPVNVDTILQVEKGKFEIQDGQFLGRPPAEYPWSEPAQKLGTIKAMATGRLDGDGLDDVAVAIPFVKDGPVNYPAQLVAGASSGQGFEQTSSLSAVDAEAAANPGTARIFAADANGDDILDLVSVNVLVDSIGFHLGAGDGTFSDAQLYANVAPNVKVAQFEQINPDEDTFADLISVGSDSVYISHGVSPELAGGGFPFEPPVSMPYPGVKAEAVVAADFNGDGFADLAVADSQLDLLVLYLNVGSRRFAAETLVFHTRPDPREIQGADLDNDGCIDIVVRCDRGFTVFRNRACD